MTVSKKNEGSAAKKKSANEISSGSSAGAVASTSTASSSAVVKTSSSTEVVENVVEEVTQVSQTTENVQKRKFTVSGTGSNGSITDADLARAQKNAILQSTSQVVQSASSSHLAEAASSSHVMKSSSSSQISQSQKESLSSSKHLESVASSNLVDSSSNVMESSAMASIMETASSLQSMSSSVSESKSSHRKSESIKSSNKSEMLESMSSTMVEGGVHSSSLVENTKVENFSLQQAQQASSSSSKQEYVQIPTAGKPSYSQQVVKSSSSKQLMQESSSSSMAKSNSSVNIVEKGEASRLSYSRPTAGKPKMSSSHSAYELDTSIEGDEVTSTMVQSKSSEFNDGISNTETMYVVDGAAGSSQDVSKFQEVPGQTTHYINMDDGSSVKITELVYPSLPAAGRPSVSTSNVHDQRQTTARVVDKDGKNVVVEEVYTYKPMPAAGKPSVFTGSKRTEWDHQQRKENVDDDSRSGRKVLVEEYHEYKPMPTAGRPSGSPRDGSKDRHQQSDYRDGHSSSVVVEEYEYSSMPGAGQQSSSTRDHRDGQQFGSSRTVDGVEYSSMPTAGVSSYTSRDARNSSSQQHQDSRSRVVIEEVQYGSMPTAGRPSSANQDSRNQQQQRMDSSSVVVDEFEYRSMPAAGRPSAPTRTNQDKDYGQQQKNPNTQRDNVSVVGDAKYRPMPAAGKSSISVRDDWNRDNQQSSVETVQYMSTSVGNVSSVSTTEHLQQQVKTDTYTSSAEDNQYRSMPTAGRPSNSVRDDWNRDNQQKNTPGSKQPGQQNVGDKNERSSGNEPMEYKPMPTAGKPSKSNRDDWNRDNQQRSTAEYQSTGVIVKSSTSENVQQRRTSDTFNSSTTLVEGAETYRPMPTAGRPSQPGRDDLNRDNQNKNLNADRQPGKPPGADKNERTSGNEPKEYKPMPTAGKPSRSTRDDWNQENQMRSTVETVDYQTTGVTTMSSTRENLQQHKTSGTFNTSSTVVEGVEQYRPMPTAGRPSQSPNDKIRDNQQKPPGERQPGNQAPGQKNQYSPADSTDLRPMPTAGKPSTSPRDILNRDKQQTTDTVEYLSQSAANVTSVSTKEYVQQQRKSDTFTSSTTVVDDVEYKPMPAAGRPSKPTRDDVNKDNNEQKMSPADKQPARDQNDRSPAKDGKEYKPMPAAGVSSVTSRQQWERENLIHEKNSNVRSSSTTPDDKNKRVQDEPKEYKPMPTAGKPSQGPRDAQAPKQEQPKDTQRPKDTTEVKEYKPMPAAGVSTVTSRQSVERESTQLNKSDIRSSTTSTTVVKEVDYKPMPAAGRPSQGPKYAQALKQEQPKDAQRPKDKKEVEEFKPMPAAGRPSQGPTDAQAPKQEQPKDAQRPKDKKEVEEYKPMPAAGVSTVTRRQSVERESTQLNKSDIRSSTTSTTVVKEVEYKPMPTAGKPSNSQKDSPKEESKSDKKQPGTSPDGKNGRKVEEPVEYKPMQAAGRPSVNTKEKELLDQQLREQQKRQKDIKDGQTNVTIEEVTYQPMPTAGRPSVTARTTQYTTYVDASDDTQLKVVKESFHEAHLSSREIIETSSDGRPTASPRGQKPEDDRRVLTTVEKVVYTPMPAAGKPSAPARQEPDSPTKTKPTAGRATVPQDVLKELKKRQSTQNVFSSDTSVVDESVEISKQFSEQIVVSEKSSKDVRLTSQQTRRDDKSSETTEQSVIEAAVSESRSSDVRRDQVDQKDSMGREPKDKKDKPTKEPVVPVKKEQCVCQICTCG
jgi:hypothetical protein